MHLASLMLSFRRFGLRRARRPAPLSDTDPFRDPRIRAMDLDQLADLPFPRDLPPPPR